MKEISRVKRFEVAHCYLLGCSYSEIEAETGVSHGSIANIVGELVNGKLTIPGTPFDQVSDLRQLSSDLKKKGLQSSQALLGLLLFERLRTLEITLEHLDSWAEVTKRLAEPASSPKDFLEAALRLRELEERQAKPFETLAEEYTRLKEAVDKSKVEVDSLDKKKTVLSKEVEPLRSQLESLERAKSKIENEVGIQTTQLRELKLGVKEAQEEKTRIDRDTKDLRRRKMKLSSEVDGKEESLRKLDDLGLSNEDLLRFTSFIERTSKNEGLSGNQIRERFFSALSLFEDVRGIEKQLKAEIEQVAELAKKQCVLDGEVIGLEKRKGVLEGEIAESISSTSQRIIDMGEKGASQIQQRVTEIETRFNQLFEDALRAGEIVGEMRQMVKKGEDAGQSLKDFLEETRSGLGAK